MYRRPAPNYSPEVKRLRYLPVTEYGAGSTPVRTANRSLVVLRPYPKSNIGGIIKDYYLVPNGYTFERGRSLPKGGCELES